MTPDHFRDILTGTTASSVSHQPNLLGWSFTPAAVPGLGERFCVATATFREPPVPSNLEIAIKSRIDEQATRLTIDDNFLGLTPLAGSLQDTDLECVFLLASEGLQIPNYPFSIVAVTGLSGHAFGSWKQRGKADMWLRDILPQSIPNARILTYGYDTKLPGSRFEASILELSGELLESIMTTRSEQAVRITFNAIIVQKSSHTAETSAPYSGWS